MPSHPPVLRSKPKVHVTGSADLRPNGSRWRKRRETILSRHPLCAYCSALGFVTASDTVDHIIALALGGGPEDENLVGCCREHNTEKAKLEQAWLSEGYPVSSLETAAPIAGSLAWFIKTARNNIAS